MSNYGELIDSAFDPSKDKVYKSFVKYFNNPIMVKLKDVGNYSMYGVKTNSMLGIEHRYIIIFAFNDKRPVGFKEKLESFQWVSLQTRTLQEDYRTDIHNYVPRRISELDKKIDLKSRDSNQYVYNVEGLPLTVTLLPKSKNLDYNSNGSLVNAIETFQTIINFNF
jgi:hypothetical protein